MLISLLLIFYNLLLAFCAGIVLVNAVKSSTKFTCLAILHPAQYVLVGWLGMAMFLQIYHLFWPIQAMAHVAVWLLLVFGIIKSRKAFVYHFLQSLHQISGKMHVLFGLGLLALVLINICTRDADGDIGDYHLQAIRWMEEYKVVIGLGNIRRQLGNNSNWFLLNAFAGFGFAGIRSVYTLNAGLVIVTGLYVLPNLFQKFWMRNAVLFAYILVVATRKYTGAVTNDLIITCSIIVLFVWVVDVLEDYRPPQFQLFIIAMLCVGLVTYKLSAIPLLLLAVFLLFELIWKHKSFKYIFVPMALFGLLLLVPWLITNVLLSGYLAFPIKGSNFLDLSWQMRKEIVDFEVYANLAYARAPQVNIEFARHFTISQWWPYWIKSLDLFSIVLLLVGLFFIVLMACAFIVNKPFAHHIIQHKHHYVYLVTIVALVLWFNHGPTPRFVLGYLISATAMGIQLLLFNRVPSWVFKHKFKVFAILLFGLLAITGKSLFNNKNQQVYLLPPAYAQPTVQKFEVTGGNLLVPIPTQQCWDAPLPCTNLPDSDLVFRGSQLQDGFMINSK